MQGRRAKKVITEPLSRRDSPRSTKRGRRLQATFYTHIQLGAWEYRREGGGILTGLPQATPSIYIHCTAIHEADRGHVSVLGRVTK